MDDSLWSELPAELLELVLSFLPLVNVCKFRMVCKRWNSLLCSPRFGKLFGENNARYANARACLIVNRKLEDKDFPCMEESRWSVLDLRKKKWHDLKLDLPWGSRDMDMDGGFICTTVLNSLRSRALRPRSCVPRRGSRALQRGLLTTNLPMHLTVFNPFGGAVKVLPDPPSFDGVLEHVHGLTLKLIVDNNSNTFKVLLIMTNGYHAGCRVPCCIYESSNDQWTTAPMPPFLAVRHSGLLSMVVFQGVLYCSEYNFDHGGILWRFNFVDGSWEDTGVHFPNTPVGIRRRDFLVISNRLDLVVIDNRLFVTHSFQLEWSQSILFISEILLEQKMIKPVGGTGLSTGFPNGPEGAKLHKFRAFGFDKSKLVLCTSTGQVAMFDLKAGKWES